MLAEPAVISIGPLVPLALTGRIDLNSGDSILISLASTSGESPQGDPRPRGGLPISLNTKRKADARQSAT